MRVHICLLLIVTLAVWAGQSSRARADGWNDRQTLDALSDSSERIRFLTKETARRTDVGAINDPAPVDPPIVPEPLTASQHIHGPELTHAEPAVASDDFAGGLGDCDCGDFDCCAGCCQPCWTIWAGAIFLNHSRTTLTVFNPDDSGPGFDSFRYNFGTSAGPDLNAIRHGGALDVDFRYFQVSQMHSSLNIDNNGLSGLTQDDGGQTIFTNYYSSLQSVESNLRRNISQNVTLLAGLRYLSLRENLGAQFSLDDDGTQANLNVFGNNRLFGVQVGAQATLWDFGNFEIQTVGKIGLYGNRATAAMQSNGGDGVTTVTSASQNRAAFVGDLNFTGIYHLTDHWAVRAGYQLLWISGVALSAHQFTTIDSDTHLPNLSIDTSGSAFFNGALISLQASW